MISAPHKFVKCAACVLLAAFSISVSHASDKAMLDAFVAKGLLTPQEASVLAKESAEVVRSVESTKSLKLSARFQLQYEWIDAESYNPFRDYACSQGFIVRRFFIQADADLGGGWDARVSVDMARSRMNSILTDTYVSKKIDALDGRIFLGYMKPGFSVEDMFSSFGLNAIERSAATMYWTGAANNRRLGVGNRYMGVRWNGDIGGGLSYMLAITNAYQLSPTNSTNFHTSIPTTTSHIGQASIIKLRATIGASKRAFTPLIRATQITTWARQALHRFSRSTRTSSQSAADCGCGATSLHRG